MTNTIIAVIDKINEKTGSLVSWLNVVLILLVCFDVTRRYILKDSAAWVMELEWHLFSLIFLLSAGYTLKYNKHVRVDLFYENMSDREKAVINLTGGLLFLLPWCILIIWTSFGYAQSAWLIKESSPDPGGLPGRYVIKFAISIGFTLLALQGISMILKNIKILRTPLNQGDEH